MTIYVSGGCKNGKSSLAQRLVKAMGDNAIYYVATMIPHDNEDRERIQRHIADRDGWGFETIECPHNVLDSLRNADHGGAFLFDSVTALLANEMFLPSGEVDTASTERIEQELAVFAETVANVVFVSDYIYSDAAIYDEYTEMYRRGLAYIDRRMAARCDIVLEVCSGNVTVHKGASLWKEMAGKADCV